MYQHLTINEQEVLKAIATDQLNEANGQPENAKETVTYYEMIEVDGLRACEFFDICAPNKCSAHI